MRKNTITKAMIDEIIAKSHIESCTVFDKCTVVSMRLPNGFVLVESSACVDPENYNIELGERICAEKLINKVWELEGYRLQTELAKKAETRDLMDFTLRELTERGYEFAIDNFTLSDKITITLGGF
jgi:hypothetical protein